MVKHLEQAAEMPDAERSVKMSTLVEFFCKSLGRRKGLASLLVFCEVLNWFVAFGNIFFTASYFGYSVSEFQTSVDGYLWANNMVFENPLAEVFPR